MSGRSSCEKRKNADNGRFGAFGSLLAFFDVPEAPRGIVSRFEYKIECKNDLKRTIAIQATEV